MTKHKVQVNIEDNQIIRKKLVGKFHYNSGWLGRSPKLKLILVYSDTNHPLFKITVRFILIKQQGLN